MPAITNQKRGQKRMPAKQLIIQEGELEICRFTGRTIRKVCHDDEWYFSVVDVITAITDTASPSRYWFDLKVKLSTEGFYQLSDKIVKLKMPGSDGKNYPTDSANTETLFRIIQAIPSPRAEPFKQWLAKTGYERIQEHQNPSIAIKRAIVDYQMQGRSLEWIEARLQTIFSRRELTDEWRERGIKEGMEFAILTDEISSGTFGKTTKAHKEYKGLIKTHSLRDNMTPIELILTMLGETATKQIAQSRDAKGFYANKQAARSGGEIAGGARRKLEKETGKPVLSAGNNLRASGPSKELLTFPPSLEEKVSKFAKSKGPRSLSEEDALD
jgi:DNA-damage-inducible protein D